MCELSCVENIVLRGQTEKARYTCGIRAMSFTFPKRPPLSDCTDNTTQRGFPFVMCFV